MKIAQAIASVMNDIGKEGIAKDRRNKDQGYSFRGIDDVYNALAPILARHCVVIIPRVLSREQTTRTTAKGTTLFSVACQVEFGLYADDGSSFTCVTWGEAMDMADKATNKAMSAAYKYMAMQVFCIPTEGDNDADAASPEIVHDTHKPVASSSPPEDAKSAASKLIEKINGARSDDEVTEVLRGSMQALRQWQSISPDTYNAVQNATAARRAALKAPVNGHHPDGIAV